MQKCNEAPSAKQRLGSVYGLSLRKIESRGSRLTIPNTRKAYAHTTYSNTTLRRDFGASQQLRIIDLVHQRIGSQAIIGAFRTLAEFPSAVADEVLLARAEANGYRTGVHRESDAIRGRGKHVAMVKRNQDCTVCKYEALCTRDD